jgi:hypothetical protein
MNSFQTAVKLFQDCGPFLYPSLFIMSMGVAIAIERFIVLNRARSENRKMWDKVLPMLQSGKFQEVHGMTENSDAAISKIVSNGLARMDGPVRRDVRPSQRG